MNTVKMRYSVGTLIRYPLVFGGILAGFTYAFMNRYNRHIIGGGGSDKIKITHFFRDKFMTDLEDERKRLDRTDEDSKQMLLDSMDSVNKSRTTKR